MPMKISDRSIAQLYASLEAQRKTNPNVKIDQAQVLNILSMVGASSSASSASSSLSLDAVPKIAS